MLKFDQSLQGLIHQVSQCHQLYIFQNTYSWKWNDIAILEFPEGTDFGVKPVTLAKDYAQFYLQNEKLVVAGFGKYKVNSKLNLCFY